MVENWFVSGLPGSGKSRGSQYIVEHVKLKDIHAVHVCDYDLLYKKFRSYGGRERFDAISYGGFRVRDPKVYDETLRDLEALVTKEYSNYDLVVVEFARSKYLHAVEQFSDEFLRHSSFIFFNAEVSSCKQRVRERVSALSTEEDTHNHYVSDETFEAYHEQDNEAYLSWLCEQLHERYGSILNRLTIIDNNEQWDKTKEKIDEMLEDVTAISFAPALL